MKINIIYSSSCLSTLWKSQIFSRIRANVIQFTAIFSSHSILKKKGFVTTETIIWILLSFYRQKACMQILNWSKTSYREWNNQQTWAAKKSENSRYFSLYICRVLFITWEQAFKRKKIYFVYILHRKPRHFDTTKVIRHWTAFSLLIVNI